MMNSLSSIGLWLGHCTTLLLPFLFLTRFASANPIPADVRKADARLEKRVTIESPRIYVCDLLKIWAQQTGVALVADEKAAAQPVYVALTDVPLGDAMDALYSLLSYKEGEWQWKCVPDKQRGMAYTFVQPSAARLYATVVRKEVQDGFESDLAAVTKYLSLPENERTARGKGSLPPGMEEERTLEGLTAFIDAIPFEKRQTVMRGEKIMLPLADAPASARAFAVSEAELFRKLNPNLPYPNYTHVQFSVENFGKISPNLMIGLGTPDETGGYGYLGGTPCENQWRKNLADRWLLKGDLPDNSETEEQKMTALKPDTLKKMPQQQMQRGNPLYYLSHAAPTSFMARCPDGQQISQWPPTEVTLKVFLDYLARNQVHHKWRGHVLLLANHAWMLKDDYASLPTWQTITHLRDLEAKEGDNPLPFEEIVHTIGTVTPTQLEHLVIDFDALSGADSQQDLLRQFHRSPKLLSGALSDEGVPVTRIVSVPPDSSAPVPSVPPRIRLKVGPIQPAVDTPESEAAPTRYAVDIETTDSKGNWQFSQGFVIQAKPRPAPAPLTNSRGKR